MQSSPSYRSLLGSNLQSVPCSWVRWRSDHGPTRIHLWANSDHFLYRVSVRLLSQSSTTALRSEQKHRTRLNDTNRSENTQNSSPCSEEHQMFRFSPAERLIRMSKTFKGCFFDWALVFVVLLLLCLITSFMFLLPSFCLIPPVYRSNPSQLIISTSHVQHHPPDSSKHHYLSDHRRSQ